MNTTTCVIARLAMAVAITCGAAAATAPAHAQTVVDIPPLSFPTEDGRWGCKFNGTCPVTTATPPARGWLF